MRIFALGDLHLSFSSGKPMDVFGEHWKDHHEIVERHWRALVSGEDVVLVPGDVSWAMTMEDARPDLEWLAALPGRKILVKGNHDYWWSSMTRLVRFLPPGIIPLQYSAVKVGNLVVAGTRGWLSPLSEEYREERDGRIYRRELLRLEMALDAAAGLAGEDDDLLVMMHFPPVVSGRPTDFFPLMVERGVRTCVYGHLHGQKWDRRVDGEMEGLRYVLVSADRLGFRPLEIGEARCC